MWSLAVAEVVNGWRSSACIETFRVDYSTGLPADMVHMFEAWIFNYSITFGRWG